MRELKMVGLDVDGKHIICEGGNPADKFKIRVDDRLRAALRGDGARVDQTHIDIEVTNMLSPKEIQARIRAGASVEQVGDGRRGGYRTGRSGSPTRCCWSVRGPPSWQPPRIRVLADGPSVLTLLETVTSSLVARGLNPDHTDLGRLAQRGRPLDGAAGLEGRPFRQPRAFPLLPGRSRRNRHRGGRRGQ